MAKRERKGAALSLLPLKRPAPFPEPKRQSPVLRSYKQDLFVDSFQVLTLYWLANRLAILFSSSFAIGSRKHNFGIRLAWCPNLQSHRYSREQSILSGPTIVRAGVASKAFTGLMTDVHSLKVRV